LSVKVKIENFQSIKDIEFEIDKYTVLTGPSNSGKSAICRAIEGALFNRSGDGFVRNGEKHAQVTVTTDTHEIVWTKGSGKNHYTINGESYDKVGTDVPELIYQMGFRDIELTRSKLRPQMGTDQFDILFLIREQGSLISEVFSVLGRLDVITKAGKECGTDLKSKKSLLKTRYDDLATVDRKLSNYQGFEKIELAADSLQIDHEEITEETQQVSLLQDLWDKLSTSVVQISSLSPVSKLSIPIEVDTKLISQLKGLSTAHNTLAKLDREIKSLNPVSSVQVPDFTADKLVTLIKQLTGIRDNHQRIESEISSLQQLAHISFPEVVPVEQVQSIELLRGKHLELVNLNQEMDSESVLLSNIIQQIGELEDSLHSMLEGLEECPLCNQALENAYVH
jgi:energy-coupling factor transporter ATP-binding protein EcfA2